MATTSSGNTFRSTNGSEHDSSTHHQPPTPPTTTTTTTPYAHIHIGPLLALPPCIMQEEEEADEADGSSSCNTRNHTPTAWKLQKVSDGSRLTAQALLSGALDIHRPIFVTDSPESIGMKLPKKAATTSKTKTKNLSVRDICHYIGPHHPVRVIDVRYQEELHGWSMEDLVEYFEDEMRLLSLSSRQDQHQFNNNDNLLPPPQTNTTCITEGEAKSSSNSTLQQPSQSSSPPRRSSRRRRRTAKTGTTQQQANDDDYAYEYQQPPPHVLNQISLEFSHTPLARHVLSPQFVRDLDWIDCAWKNKEKNKNKSSSTTTATYPRVQYYCLTSSAGSYTDFHIDFGGTSVWYHVLSGQKVFALLPPSDRNLQIYETWLCAKDQAVTFLPDLVHAEEKAGALDDDACFQVTLQPGHSLFIPCGWIHAVYTPCDSLVFGGNFLHGCDISLQLEVYDMECRCSVQKQFRFPYFVQLQFYVAALYHERILVQIKKKNRSTSRNNKIMVAKTEGTAKTTTTISNRSNVLVVERELQGLPHLIDAIESWWNAYKATAMEEEEKEKVGNGEENGGRRATSSSSAGAAGEITIGMAAREAASRCGYSCSNNNNNRDDAVDSWLAALRFDLQRAIEADKETTSSSGTSTASSAAASSPAPAVGVVLQPEEEESTAPPFPSPVQAPKIRLKVPDSSSEVLEADVLASPSSVGSSSPFRIRLSHKSAQSAAVPPSILAPPTGGRVNSIKTKTAKQEREDTEWFVNEQDVAKDEEWTPSTRKRKQQPRASCLAPKRKSPAAKTPTTTTYNTPNKKSKAATTSRQRLSKKVGW